MTLTTQLRSLLNDMRPGASKPTVKWWHGALFLGAVSVIGRISTGSIKDNKEQDEFYEKEKTPPWSPPAWLFGVAWPLNNIALTWGGLRLLNEGKTLKNRNALLALQGVHWLIFMTFGWAYFRKKSPVLALAWTQADTLVALSSLTLAYRDDRKLAWAYLPLSLWTSFASSVAWYQALYNPDPYLETEPLAEELPELVS
ncbi:tryptophan-rich sensory protein [Catalinimonas alkaloidigena]|uniref:Tryptophan-rich sensory protein n=1 Tax=Catalinimonas alkaloidigena TaxID=1075417 RepID=A0A1G9T7T8_9BACT|nr:TspO/MBR family protein [Catalinimonas alkaloidigena]SDM43718.1 tryptophan-rich sensory protein [Catalinimonas alkaloidigena]